MVNMTVRPADILIGDIIRVNGGVARVKMIYELWDGTYTLIITCLEGKYSYIAKYAEHEPVTLLSI